MSEKKVNIKRLVILTAVLPVVVIILCSIAIYFTAHSVVPDNEIFNKNEEKPDIISAPGTKEAALELINNMLIETAGKDTVKLENTVSVQLKNIEGENKSLIKILDFVKSSYNDRMSRAYKGIDVNYGGDAGFIKNMLPDCEVSDFEVSYDGDIMKVALIYPSFEGTDFETADRNMAKKAADENKDIVEMSGGTPERTKSLIRALINKKDGSFIKISVERSYNISMTLSFIDELSEMGTSDISFDCDIISSFNFTEAGINIRQGKIVLHKNGFETPDIQANIDKDAPEDEYSLKFYSSDENILTVSENGMIEAVNESETPVTVTAELKYLGKTFTDTAEVWVVKEVKKIKINKKSAEMLPGESFTLEAEAKPDDATIKGIKYVSADENIAEVDSKGKVTAKNSGTVKIYALSDDGVHGIACNVTVK